MDREPVTDSNEALTQRVSRVLAGTARYTAPASLQEQVLRDIERHAQVRWWQRRVPEWPWLAQVLFGLTGIAAAAALLLGRPTAPRSLGVVISQPAAVLRQPAADLHTTLNVLALFHRLTGVVAGSLPDTLWYGGMAACAVSYVTLFFLVVFGYRLLQAPAPHAEQMDISR